MTYTHHTKLVLVEGGNIFKQGDHPTLKFIAYDSLGNEVDLTNKQIEGALYSRNKGIMYEAPASFTDGRIVFTIDELLDNGKFQLEFTATDSADPDYRAKFPSDEYAAQLTIKPSKDNMDFVGVSMTTVAQLKTELQGLQTEFAGQVLPRVDIVEDKQTQLEADYQAAAGALTEDSEVILARKGEPTLRAFNDKITTQLDDKDKKIKSVDNRRFYSDRIVKHNKRRPLITILDDDTRKELYTKLHPIMLEYGLPYTAAVVTGRIGTNQNTITKAEYDEMLHSELVEYISHTVSHQDLTTLTLDQVEAELKNSKEWVLENGGNPDYFVTPFGMTTPDTLRLMRKYYKAAFRTDDLNYLAKPPLTTFDVARSDFEKTVAVQKARIDNTIPNNGWLIVNTHSAYASFTEANMREVIDYALLKGLEFVTIGEGMQAFGNLIDLADNGTAEHGGIDADGVAFGVLAQKYPVRESLQTGTVVVPANSNAAALVTPTKMALVNSKVYMLTPTANVQGVVYTWSIDTSGRIVFRFNNLTSTEKSLILTFTIAEVLSTS